MAQLQYPSRCGKLAGCPPGKKFRGAMIEGLCLIVLELLVGHFHECVRVCSLPLDSRLRMELLGIYTALLCCFCAVAMSAEMTSRPGVPDCTLHWATQFIDNFGWNPATYKERFYVYDKYYRPGGPIFFYTGNEGNVELYVNFTGLMWENGERFHALLVFAEHRFFGESMPCSKGIEECGDYLGVDQAMADYARLIGQLRRQYPTSSATIVFGGSYGGMLSAWMRIRYPLLVDGAVASSAPIGCLSGSYIGESYWAIVTTDATSAAGSARNCSANVWNGIMGVISMSKTADWRARLTEIFHLCSPLQLEDVDEFLLFIQGAFDAMAMGNYPYPSWYIGGTPEHPAPAWPMRVACEFMEKSQQPLVELFTSLHSAIGVINNISGEVKCYDIKQSNPSVYSSKWDFMVCTEALINEQPYFAAAGWPQDMFWKQPVWTPQMFEDHCMKLYKRKPRWGLLNASYGVEALKHSSNIVLANGLLDPWHSGGILSNVSSSVVALIIPEGAHHLDLMFSSKEDPPSVIAVRATQMRLVEQWIAEAKKAQRTCDEH